MSLSFVSEQRPASSSEPHRGFLGPSSASEPRVWRRHPVLAVLIVVGGIFLVALISELLVARNDLSAAKRDLQRAKELVVKRDDAGARAAVDAAFRHLRRAESIGGSFPLALTAPIPGVGTPAKAVRSASKAGLDVANAATLVVDAADAFPTQGSKGIDGHDLSAFNQGSIDAIAKLRQADEQLAAAQSTLDGPAGAWLPLISNQAIGMRAIVTSTRNDLSGAQRGLALLQDLTDPATDARILLLSQDTMELRPTGGYIGSYGVLHFSHGTVRLDNYAATEELPEPNPTPAPPERLAASLIVQPYDIRNVNWWPNFPATASAARDMFRLQGGGDVDGVIAITEPVLARLVGALGPQTVPGYDQPVVEEGFQDRVLYEVQTKRPRDTPRKKFLSLLSRQIFDQIFALPPSKTTAVIDAINASVAAGDVQAWFESSSRQRQISGTQWSGEIPVERGDFVMMVDADLAGIQTLVSGKANRDVSKFTSYQVREQGDHYVARLTVRYVSGPASFTNTSYAAYLRVYVPTSASLVNQADGYSDEGLAPDAPYRVFSKSVTVLPDTEQTIAFDYTLPGSIAEGGQYQLTWVRQAGTAADNIRVSVPGVRTAVVPETRTFTLG